MHIIDRLIGAVEEKQNPTVVGLDTCMDYLPEGYLKLEDGDVLERCADAITKFNKELVDALCEIVPAVKVQAAYYEMYGVPGMRAFYDTLTYAAQAGMVVIADAKRGDIGSTAQAYSSAFLGETKVQGRAERAFPADMLTVNPYFGTDGVAPFIAECPQKGVFILVKTSNPSGKEIQDIDCGGRPLYMHVADKVMEWGVDSVGNYGYSAVGAVVGATYPEQGAALREYMKNTFFLVPGYGAQGATAHDLRGCFDAKGHGAIVNASRSILCAWKKQSGMSPVDAARVEALRMKSDLLEAIGGIG